MNLIVIKVELVAIHPLMYHVTLPIKIGKITYSYDRWIQRRIVTGLHNPVTGKVVAIKIPAAWLEYVLDGLAEQTGKDIKR